MLYLWEEGLWHRCWRGEWAAGNYTAAEYKCFVCGFTHPYLEILIPFLDRYLKATPNIEGVPQLNCYYYTHRYVIDMTNFEKERKLL